MATISSSLQLFDRFSQTLNRAVQGVQEVLTAAEKLNQELRQPISLNVDVSGAVAHVNQMREQIQAAGAGSAIHIVIDADGITQEISRIQQRIRTGISSAAVKLTIDSAAVMQELGSIRARIIQQIGTISAQIQLQLPNTADIRAQLTNALRGFPSSPITITFDSTAVMQELGTLRTRIIQRIGTIHAQIRLQVPDTAAIRTQLTNALRGFASSPVTIRPRLDAHQALADLQALKNRIRTEIGSIRAQINIQFNAAVTVMLANLQKLVYKLLTAVRRLGATSSNTAQLQSALQRIAALEARINQLQEQLNNRLRQGGSASSGLLGNLQGMASAYMGIVALHKAVQFINWADGIASTNARLSMINDGTQTQLELQSKVMKVANDTRQAYRETASMVAQLGASTQGVFKDNQSVLSFVSRFNKLLITGGASAEESKSAILQMTQALSSGVLQGDELRSLSETAPMLMKVLADGLGVSRGSLKKMGADGKLTSAAIVQAFEKQDVYINRIFGNMPVTFGQAMTVMKNKAAGWISTLNGANGPIQRITKSIMRMVEWLDTDEGQTFFANLSVGINALADGFEWFANIIVTNMDIVQTVLIAIGIVVLALAAKWLIMWAIAAWPVFAIIGAIALILVILNRFGITTRDVVGAVFGFFNALFAGIWNGVAYVWNYIISFAEFLVNIFNDPVYAIEKLFYDMIKNIAGYFDGLIGGIQDSLNWLSDKVNWLTGIDLGTMDGSVDDWLESIKPQSDEDVIDLDKYKMDFKDLADAYKQGDDYGNGLFDKMNDNLNDINRKGDAWSNKDIGKVDEVGKINKSVEISSEDIAVMRDLAEMKSIQNYVTLTPTVNVTTGPVTKEVDVDEVINKIGVRVTEEIEASASSFYE